VHRTVSGAQAGSMMNSLLSGIAEGPAAKIHRTVRCALDYSVSQQRPHQRSVVRSTGDMWLEPTINRPHRTVRCAPDSVQCAKWLRVQRSASPKKERNHALFMSGGAPDCPVRQPTEGRNCLPNGDPTAPSCLGAIKGTLRRIEHPKTPRLRKHASGTL
jgi:hypothetical protein